MKTRLLLFFLLFTAFANAQIVNIPDPNFKASLISEGVDTNNDGEIQESEASRITFLDLRSLNISDLTGISSFSNLEFLDCFDNQLSSLDVSGLSNLTTLVCNNNQLSSLDVSDLTSLTHLFCDNNQLSSLDVSNLTSLIFLVCNDNQLSSLDVNPLVNLGWLNCDNNQLTSLFIKNGYTQWDTIYEPLSFSSNPNLSYICANEKDLELINSIITTYGYTNCNVDSNCDAPILNIPDANFKAKLLEASPENTIASTAEPNIYGKVTTYSVIDTNGDAEIQESEAKAIKVLNVTNSSIADLTGIASFSNLKVLICDQNQLASIDVGALTNLTVLSCSKNQLSSLDVSGLTNLTILSCSENQLSSIDVSALINLSELYCNFNQLSSLDVSALTNLKELYCLFNQITDLDIGALTNLTILSCSENQLSSIDVSALTSLEELYCGNNKLTSLDVNNLYNLYNLSCMGNQLESLFLKTNHLGTNVYLFSSNPNLSYVCVNEQDLVSISDYVTNIGYTNCNVDSNCDALILNIPDVNFKAKLLAASSDNKIASTETPDSEGNVVSYNVIDANGDGEIQVSEASAITYLDVSSSNISDLTGISGFSNLEMLVCTGNQITVLDLNNLFNLRFLYCNNNELASLDVSTLTNLEKLYCYINQLTSLDLGPLTNLSELYCNNNQLTSLDVSALTSLETLVCRTNQLTSLDVNNLFNLSLLSCEDNQLDSLFMKTNHSGDHQYYFSQNPNIRYVCVNEKDLSFFKNLIVTYKYTNCHVNTYCSFTPGGEFYTITGNTTLDYDNNGCDENDIAYPNLKFDITDGANNGSLIANGLDAYSIPVSKGTQIVTPQLENPDYFNVSPTSATVSFPTETNPFTQDFCVTPNGVKNDLEIFVIPIEAARPGFDATYKIKYKNKGNTVRSGAVTLAFDDAVLDFVSASPAATVEQGLLSWTFIDLKPFETDEILVTFNLNGPTETPALNGDDILSYIVTINADTDDIEETPEDNEFTLNQTVVNSYDPNDKICLEGDTITPEKVGQFVHYRIRFENTGTAEAINIVVKDVIDATKFDVSTLAIVDASHEMYTRINGNTVEFIFEGINLSFEDVTNDGYLVFKIKTLENLTLGDTFENTAEIYFDYNFPIITNEYKTIIKDESLSSEDFEFTGALSAYPNPVKDMLSIDTKASILKLEVFDMAGRKISVNTVNNNQANLRHLGAGNYIAKIYTFQGVKQIKILKQ